MHKATSVVWKTRLNCKTDQRMYIGLDWIRHNLWTEFWHFL